jgi:two-component system chemotaxis sensor kinase CheA
VRPGRKAKSYCIVATVADRRVGFIVDKLVGQQDIVIKALGKSLKKARGLAGATELGDQRVGLVLDAAALINEVLASTPEGRIAGHLEGPRSPKVIGGGPS